jgi:ABC-2 type transport system permease protein
VSGPLVSPYTRFELLRTVRNRRLVIFSFGFPLVLYLLIAGPNRGEDDLGGSGISAPLYFMVGLAAFGVMNAVLATGARIAAERQAGWNRQLRITPLTPFAYFRAKVAASYLMACATMLLLAAAGLSMGVRMPFSSWLEMAGLMLVGLLPFVPLGLLVGHAVTADSVGPAIGGLTALLAFLGGTWFPLGDGVLADIGKALPSFWLVAASRVSTGGAAWGATGWLIVAGWSVVLAVLAARAYRLDTARV